MVLGQVHPRIRHLRHWRQHNAHRSKVQAQIPLMICHSRSSPGRCSPRALVRSSSTYSCSICSRRRSVGCIRIESCAYTATMYQWYLIVRHPRSGVIQEDLLLQIVPNVAQRCRIASRYPLRCCCIQFIHGDAFVFIYSVYRHFNLVVLDFPSLTLHCRSFVFSPSLGCKNPTLFICVELTVSIALLI